MSGLLAALLFVFLLQGRSHRLVDMAEVEAHTTAPVLPERGPGGLAAAVVIAMLPVERRKMLVCNLGTQQDVERVVTALREAIARDPESDLQLVLLESGFQGEDPTLSVVRQVHEVVLIVNPRTTTTGELQQTLGILDLLDVSIIATVWSTSPRGGRASHKTQKSLRVLPRKGAA